MPRGKKRGSPSSRSGATTRSASGSERGVAQKRLRTILDEGKDEVECRVKELMDHASTIVSKIQRAFWVEVTKLPREVQDMPYSEFRDKFGCDVRAVQQEKATRSGTLRSTRSSTRMPPPTAAKARAAAPAQAAPMMTPAPSRRARVAFSAIKTTMKPKASASGAPMLSLQVTSADTGEEMDVADPSVIAKLGDQEKAEVFEHISSLQSQLGSIMAQFNPE